MAHFERQKPKDAPEFPFVCETCLGDNPYVRMTKESRGKRCQICETPFTLFSWQAGTKGRVKRVEICRNCAQAKNVCQVCIYDLQYGLPVKVRDDILKEHGGVGAVSNLPTSRTNRAWHTQQQERLLEQGGTLVKSATDMARAKLQQLAQMEPKYERNLPKICTFYAKGECDRGANCPFRHEFLPEDEVQKQRQKHRHTTKNRFYGNQYDEVAAKFLEKHKEPDVLEYERSKTTIYVRLQGDPPYAIALDEALIRDAFYSFGEIVSVSVQPDKGQAFVEYSSSQDAELAIASKHKKDVNGCKILCAWARATKRGDEKPKRTMEQVSSTNSSSIQPVAPPGGKPNKKPKLAAKVKLAPGLAQRLAASRPSSVPRPTR